MRNILLLISFIFVFTLSVSAMPGYDPNDNKPIYYDVSYNIALRKNLEDAYDKKYIKEVSPNNLIDTSQVGAYYWEVIVPYDRQKQNNQDN